MRRYNPVKKVVWLFAACTALLSACGSLGKAMEPLDDPGKPQVDVEVTSGGEMGGAPDDPEPQPVITETPLPPAHPASGLIFSNAEGTWWIGWKWEVALLTDVIIEDRSPDGSQGLYIESGPETPLGDIGVVDLATGEKRGITNTPERAEVMPRFVPGREGLLVFGSDTELGMANARYPTVVRLDGEGYEILDAEVGGFRDISPDGRMFVYGGYGSTNRIYRWDDGFSIFDPVEYGLTVDKLYDPVWSQQGDRIAWFVAGDFSNEGTAQIGLAVFDLLSKTSKLMHVYKPAGGSEFINQIAWSPNGEWLAFTTHNEPPATGRQPNLWVVRSDGTEEVYIGEGAAPVWRYDSEQLAFQALNEAQTEEVYLVDSGTWEIGRIEDLELPERILSLLDWRAP